VQEEIRITTMNALPARVVYAGCVTVLGSDQLFSEVECMKSLKRKTTFPDEVTLKRIREKLSDPKYQGGNLALPGKASEVDRAKYQLCQLIARYQREHGLLQKDIARKLGVDESRISDILGDKIESFTLDRLIGYAEKLHPRIRVQVIAA
jgi:predicted XRE-type DNA-binding protein